MLACLRVSVCACVHGCRHFAPLALSGRGLVQQALLQRCCCRPCAHAIFHALFLLKPHSTYTVDTRPRAAQARAVSSPRCRTCCASWDHVRGECVGVDAGVEGPACLATACFAPCVDFAAAMQCRARCCSVVAVSVAHARLVPSAIACTGQACVQLDAK